MKQKPFLYLLFQLYVSDGGPERDSYPLLGPAGAMGHRAAICGVHGGCLGQALV